MIYVYSTNKNQLKQEVNVEHYYRIVKIKPGYMCFDGYMCFNSADEFERWVQDDPPPYRVIKI